MAQVDKKQYLKKYLSSDAKNEKKKKRKKKPVTGASVTIIDDDVDLSQINSLQDAANLMEANEDAPQVVGVIDDRPMHLRIADYQTNQWKPLGASEDMIDYGDKPSLDVNLTPKELISLTLKTNTKVKDYVNIKPVSRPSNSVKASDDYSPPRRRRKPSDSDTSPPRKKSPSYSKSERSGDMSPTRRQRRSSDNSPPRRSPSIRYSDRSPTRKSSSRRRDDFDDRSLSKRTSHGNDNSPPKRSRFSSPPRRPNDSIPGQPDESKRKLLPGNAKGKYLIPQKRTSDEKMTKTLDGKTAGLQNAKELVLENELFRQREDEMFKNMSVELSGVNAAPVFRDHKTGKKRDLEKEAEEKREKDKLEQEVKEKYSRWGRGLKQVQDHEDKLAQDMHEMNKPLARYADDEDLENYFKSRVREGDPSLTFMKNKNPIKPGTVVKTKQSMFNFMPNRFGIAPGPKWDGVNRSNGYEMKWIQEQNSKLTAQEESYKWSIEDM